MVADGAAPPRAGRAGDGPGDDGTDGPDGVDLFAAPARPEPPAPGPRADPRARRSRYVVLRRVSPAHRRPPPVAGARPGAALAIAVGLGLVGLGIAVGGSGPTRGVAAAPASVASPAAGPTASGTSVAAPSTDPGAPAAADLRATEVALPTVGVRSGLVDLDVGSGGALQAPADPAVAGWYVRGAAPGEPGPTVIAGHVDSRSGPAVFYRLDELAPGDRVEVTRSDGRVFAYRVATVEQHPKDAFPTTRVYGPTPGPELRLITCGGDFDRRSRHYRDNVVVTAIPL